MELDGNHSFVEMNDYFKKLSKEVTEKSVLDLDSNLLYEIAYASEYIDVLLIKYDFSKDILDSLNSAKEVFDAVSRAVDSLELKGVKDGIRGRLDHKKLLKARCVDLEEYKCVRESDQHNDNDLFVACFKYYAPKLLLYSILVVFFLLAEIGLSKLTLGINVDSELVLGTRVDVTKFREVYYKGYKLILGILKLTSIAGLFITTGLFAEDMLSIPFKFLGAIFGNRERVYASYIKNDYNREVRCKTWLHHMLSVLNNIEDDNTTLSKIRGRLVKLDEEIARLEAIDAYTSVYYKALARVEILHDEFLEAIEG